ncbi:MAG: sialate O-acetylesterase [Clostridia bacterium]|nr:sialate O-acetylesterase [Clostridia bacterium]
MIHSFLIIGQSNMAGRGSLTAAKPLDTCGGKLKVLRNGRWQTMYRPVNPDRPFSGTCLAESFAKAYSDEHTGIEVGIIPCADGGTTLDQWQEGGLLFDNAVYCARLAMRTSHLVGILWHQGEGDCHETKYPVYLEKITAMMAALRRELNAEDVPIVVGGLGDFLKDMTTAPALANYPHVNSALREFAASAPRVAFASAEGLTSNPDNLHFNHESLQAFGLRYYEAFKTVEDKERVFDEKSKMDDAVRTAMELL